MLTFDLPGAEFAFEKTNRCLFCFSKVSSAKIFPVTKFNEVWNHLVPEDELEFSVTPPLCSNCKRTVESLYSALIRLTDSTIKIRTVIAEAGRNDGSTNHSRFGELVEDLKQAGVGDKCRGALALLEKLGHDEIFEEDYQTWFQDAQIETTEVKKEEFYDDTNMMIKHEPDPGNFLDEGDTFPHSLHSTMNRDSYPVLATEFQSGRKQTVKKAFFKTNSGNRLHTDELRKSSRIKDQQVVSQSRRILNKYVASASQKAKPKNRKKHYTKQPPKQPKQKKKAPLIPNRSKGGGHVYRCDFCLKYLPKSGISKHVRDHVGDYAISCPNPDCLYVCTTSTQLMLHVRRKPDCKALVSIKPFLTCQTCGHEATSTRLLLEHLLTSHEEDEKPFPCPVVNCSEKFSTRQAVLCHIRRHSSFALKGQGALGAPPSYQKCSICFNNIHESKTRAHLETVHGIPSESIIPCNCCPHLFSSWKHLLYHLRTHIFNGVSVTCSLCPSETPKGVFTKISLLRQHLRDSHQIGSPFQCKLCPHVCWSETGIVYHMRATHKNTQKRKKPRPPKKCDMCSKTLPNNNELVAHMIQTHGENPLTCDVCGDKFEHPTLLNHHKSDVHLGIKRRQPRTPWYPRMPGHPRSPKQPRTPAHPRTPGHLRTPRATQEKITNILCSQCGKVYKDKNSLNCHVRLMHMNLVFPCTVCGKSFKAKRILKNHQKTKICKNRAIEMLSNKTIQKYERLRNKGDRFSCGTSGQRFVDNSGLRGHKHQVQGDDTKVN